MTYRLEVMNPVAETSFNQINPAARPSSLDGKILGLFWNSKLGGEVALEHLARRIQERYQGVRVEWFSNHFPAPLETIIAAAERSDIAIGATGD